MHKKEKHAKMHTKTKTLTKLNQNDMTATTKSRHWQKLAHTDKQEAQLLPGKADHTTCPKASLRFAVMERK